MQIVFELLVVVHFIGLASLLGGVITQITASEKVVNRAMVDGALTQLVSGIALVGVAQMALPEEAADLNMVALGAKLLILLVIVTLVWANRKRASVPVGVWAAIGVLTLTNIVIAVFM
jgi:hypothetical protein